MIHRIFQDTFKGSRSVGCWGIRVGMRLETDLVIIHLISWNFTMSICCLMLPYLLGMFIFSYMLDKQVEESCTNGKWHMLLFDFLHTGNIVSASSIHWVITKVTPLKGVPYGVIHKTHTIYSQPARQTDRHTYIHAFSLSQFTSTH